MKIREVLLVLLFAAAFFMGCDQPSKTMRSVAVEHAEKSELDVLAILANVSELREEKLFLVTLKFEKEQVTLDLWALAKNDASAEYRTIIVGERTFNEYQLGQRVSSVGDSWGLVFNGEIAEYVVSPYQKTIESQYFWVDRSGFQTQIQKEQYEAVLQQLRSQGRPLLTNPFAGVLRTYVLDKPFEDYRFVTREPLNRYFMTIRVENSSLSLDLTKHIRNMANTHEITVEVPREVYERVADVWNETFSTGSFIMKGHLSGLRGTVVKKWVEIDKAFQRVKTADGKQFIIVAK